MPVSCRALASFASVTAFWGLSRWESRESGVMSAAENSGVSVPSASGKYSWAVSIRTTSSIEVSSTSLARNRLLSR